MVFFLIVWELTGGGDIVLFDYLEARGPAMLVLLLVSGSLEQEPWPFQPLSP